MNKDRTEFGSAVAQAIDANNNDINQLVWKYKTGDSMRLMDMTNAQLQKVYNHTTDMLYNNDRETPGKYMVKKNLARLVRECNAEMFKRYLIYECNIDALKTPMQIVTLVREFRKQNNLLDTDPVSTLFDHLPQEFTTVTFDDLISACLDQLGTINRKMISEQFIISRGIWLKDDEKTELSETDDEGKRIPWLDVVRDRLMLPDSIKLHVNPRGFSYGELRALVHLSQLPKISSLSTDTLRLMRDKVLPLLDNDTDWHIKKWENIKSGIEKVANYKKFELTSKNY